MRTALDCFVGLPPRSDGDYVYRHCEERKRRGNPVMVGVALDCFTLSGMTITGMTFAAIEKGAP